MIRKRKVRERLLTGILCLSMCFTSLPVHAYVGTENDSFSADNYSGESLSGAGAASRTESFSEEREAGSGIRAEEESSVAESAFGEEENNVKAAPREEGNAAEAAPGEEENSAKAASGKEGNIAEAAPGEENNAKAASGEERNGAEAVPGEEGNGSEAMPGEEENDAETAPGEEGDGIEAMPGEEDNDAEAAPGEEGNGAEAVPGEEGNGAEAVPGEEGNGAETVPGEEGNDVEAAPGGEGNGTETALGEEGDGTETDPGEEGNETETDPGEEGNETEADPGTEGDNRQPGSEENENNSEAVPGENENNAETGTEEQPGETQTVTPEPEEKQKVNLQFDVLWDDQEDFFGVRFEPEFILWADGIKADHYYYDQLERIHYEDGVETLEIRDLPAGNGEEEIVYTLEEEPAAGFESIVRVFETNEEQTVLNGKVAFDAEKGYQALGRFENSLTIWTVTGELLWDTGKLPGFLRPETMKDLLDVTLEDGRDISDFQAEFTVDEDNEDLWHYTVTLPAVAEKNGKETAVYHLTLKKLDGLSLEGGLGAPVMVNGDVEIAERTVCAAEGVEDQEGTDREEQSGERDPETEGEGSRASGRQKKIRKKASPVSLEVDQTTTVVESNGGAKLEKEWVDNNNEETLRPTSLVDSTYLSIYFQIEGGEEVPFGPDAIEKLGLTKEALGFGAGETVTSEALLKKLVTEEITGIGYASYEISGFPSKIKTGEEEKTVSYTIRETKVPGYQQVVEGNKVYNILETKFSANVQYRAGEQKLNESDNYPHDLKLKALTGSGEEVQETGVDLNDPQYWKWDEASGTWKLSIEELPKYTKEGKEIVYVVDADSCYVLGTEDGDVYRAEYDNSASPNHGTDTSALYDGGTLNLTRTGKETYKATKIWLDDGSPATEAARPDGTLRLWRYTNRGGNDYTTASRVLVDGKDLTASLKELDDAPGSSGSSKKVIVFKDADGKEYQLEKYDPEGYHYVYLVRESMEGSGYEQIIESAAGDPNAANDSSIYNGYVIKNRRVGTVQTTAEKKWIAASEQGSLSKAEVTLKLQRRTKGSAAEAEWKDVEGSESVMGNFSSVITSDTVSKSMPRYDEEGLEYEYRWVEGGITFNGEPVEMGSDEIVEGNTTKKTFTMNGEQYESVTTTSTDENGNQTVSIENRLVGTSTYRVVKVWEGQSDWPEGKKVTVEFFSRKNNEAAKSLGTFTFNNNSVENSSISFTVNGKTITADVKSNGYSESDGGFVLEFTGLPKFDENGYKFDYEALEKEIKDGGWNLKKTEKLTDDSGNPVGVKFTNGTVGEGSTYRIRIQKNWLDDGDVKFRGPVEVGLFYKEDRGLDRQIGGNITLKQDGNWWEWLAGIQESDWNLLKNESNREKFYLKELSITIGTTKYSPGGSISTSAGDKKLPDNYIATDTTVFEILPVEWSELFSGAGEPTATITNRRVGFVDYTVTKKWLDEGADPDARPGAKLVLYCDSMDYLSNPSKAGTDGYYTAEQINYGSVPIAMSQAVNRNTPSGTSETYKFENLPKYDKNGKVIHYKVAEEWNDPGDAESKEYVSIFGTSSYEHYSLSYNDQSKIEVDNKREKTTDLKFYKIWVDMWNFKNGNRPDIFLRFFQRDSTKSAAEGITVDMSKLAWDAADQTEITGDLLKAMVNSGDELLKELSGDTERQNYLWKCTIKDMPKYDANGREIEYFAVENFAANPENFDYTSEYYNSKGEISSETVSGTIPAVEEGGFFVNRQKKDVLIEGKKLWQNIPSGFATNDLPEVTFSLERRLKEDTGGDFQPVEGVTAKLDEGKTIFSFGRSPGAGLPKYDDLGRLYEYRVVEQEQDWADKKIYLEPLTNSYTITNIYNTSLTGSLEVQKKWKDHPENKRYPVVTFDLYRRYKKTGEAYSEWDQIDTKTINSSEFTGNGEKTAVFENLLIYAPNGEKYEYKVVERSTDGYVRTCGIEGGDFSEITVTDEDGNEEAPSVSFDEASSTGDGEKTYIASDVIYTNTYTPDSVELTGKKIWDDKDNVFCTRPPRTELYSRLHFYRYAESQENQNNPIAEEAIELQTENPDQPNYFQWTTPEPETGNEWAYKITNLQRYAPNGMPWKYKLGEDPDPHNAYNLANGDGTKLSQSISVNQDSVDGSTGNVRMKNLTNLMDTQVTVTKFWSDFSETSRNDEYLTRNSKKDIKIGIKLQMREKGEEEFKDISKEFHDKLGASYEPEFVLTGGDTTSWKTFDHLPAGHYREDGTWIEYEYRVVETWIQDGDEHYNVDVDFEKAKYGGEYNDFGIYTTEAGSYIITLKHSANTRPNIYDIRNKLKNESVLKITVQKSWDGSEAAWPITYVIKRFVVQADGSKVTDTGFSYSGTLTEGAPSKTLNVLPVAPNGLRYEYYAEETSSASGTVEDDHFRPNGNKKVYLITYTTDENKANNTQTFTMTNRLASLHVVKNWADDGTGRPGDVTFTLQRYILKRDGTPTNMEEVPSGEYTLKDWVKNENSWERDFENLSVYGTIEGSSGQYVYTVKETEVSGYKMQVGDTSVSEDGLKQTVEVVNTKNAFYLDKVDESGTKLNGAVITLTGKGEVSGYQIIWNRKEDGCSVSIREQGSSEPKTVTGTDFAAITGIPAGTYEISEVETPRGYYSLAEGYQLKISQNGGDLAIEVIPPEDEPGGKDVYVEEGTVRVVVVNHSISDAPALSFEKTDMEGKALLGATFAIEGKYIDPDGKCREGKFDDGSAYTFTISDASVTLHGVLLAGETYVLKEISAPENYQKTEETFTFMLDSDGKIQNTAVGTSSFYTVDENRTKITICNEVMRGHVKLIKVLEDNTGTAPSEKRVNGAVFKLYKQVGDSPDPSSDILIAENLVTDSAADSSEDGVWNSEESDAIRRDKGSLSGGKQEYLRDGLEPGIYYFMETEVPSDVKLNADAKWSFSIPGQKEGMGEKKWSVGVEAKNEPFKTQVTLKKLDGDAAPAEGIAGAKFRLFRLKEGGSAETDADYELYPRVENEEDYEDLSTDGDGTLIIRNLIKGTYLLKETEASGYDPETFFAVRFTISDADHDRELVLNAGTLSDSVQKLSGEWNSDGVLNHRLYGSVSVMKIDATEKVGLNGAEFTLQKKTAEGESFQDYLKGLITGHAYRVVRKSGSADTFEEITESPPELKAGQLYVEGLDWAVYRFAETKAPDGYILKSRDGQLAVSDEFTVDRAAVSGDLPIELEDISNAPVKLSLIKKDYVSEDSLEHPVMAGVTFKLYDVSSDRESEITDGGPFVTGTDGKVEFTAGKLVQDHTYRLYEVPPQGYEGYPESGTPEPVPVIDFTVKDDGTAEILYPAEGETAEAAGSQITLYNRRVPGTIRVTKTDTDGDGSIPLEGAEFCLYKKHPDESHVYGEEDLVREVFDGTVITKTRSANPVSTDGKGTAEFRNLPWGTYVLAETKAPDGYVLPGDPDNFWEFVIGPSGSEIEVRSDKAVTNTKNLVKFQKYDENDLSLVLTGAEFALKPAEGSSFAKTGFTEELVKGFNAAYTSEKGITWTSSVEPFVLEGYLIAGNTYTLTETKAPGGYYCQDPITFTMNADNTVTLPTGRKDTVWADGLLSIADRKIQKHVKLTKTAEEGAEGGGPAGDESQGTVSGIQFDLYRQNGKNDLEDPLDLEKDEKIASGLTTDENGEWTSVENHAEIFKEEDGSESSFAGGLPSGTYYFLETNASEDTSLNTKPQIFVIEDQDPGNGTTQSVVEVNVVNALFHAAVRLIKLDSENGQPVSDVAFRLYEKKNGVKQEQYVEKTTDSTGKVLFENLHKGTYRIEETAAPGYDLTGNKGFIAEFEIQEEDDSKILDLNSEIVLGTSGNPKLTLIQGSWNENGILNDRLYGEVSFIKKGEALPPDSGMVSLDGAEFTLQKKDKDGNFQDYLTGLLTGRVYEVTREKDKAEGVRWLEEETAKPGELVVKGLDWAVYKFVETKAPEGYSRFMPDKTSGNGDILDSKPVETQEFTVDRALAADSALSVELSEVEDQLIRVSLVKKDYVSSSADELDRPPLSGVKFVVKEVLGDGSEGEVPGMEGELETDQQGRLDFTAGKLIQGRTYRLYECTYAGYQEEASPVAAVDFTVNEDGTVTLKEQGSAGKASGEIFGSPQVNGSVITLYNKRVPGSVRLKKTDAEGAPLEGAEFALYHKKNDPSREYTDDDLVKEVFDGTTVTDGREKNPGATGADGMIAFENLPWGDYVLKETKAPEGYKLEEGEYSFTVGADGMTAETETDFVSIVTEDGAEYIVFKDAPICGQIQKLDGNTEEALEGAEFTLSKEIPGGEASVNLVTGENGLAEISKGFLVQGMRYSLKETKPPAGYLLMDGEISFTVGTDGGFELEGDGGGRVSVSLDTGKDPSVVTLTIRDDPVRGHVKLTKVLTKTAPSKTEERLEGVEFSLYRKADTEGGEDLLIAEGLVTDENGEWTSVNSHALRADKKDTEQGGEEYLSAGLESGSYFFKETKNIAKAVLPAEGTKLGEFTIPTFGGTAQPELAAVKVENEEFGAAMELTKTDAVSGKGLSGVVFRLTYVPEGAPEGTPPAEISIPAADTEGKLTVSGLLKGTYVLTETVPQGYTDGFSAEFTVENEDNGSTIVISGDNPKVTKRSGSWSEDQRSISNARLPGSVELTKTDAKTGEKLSHVGFVLEYRSADGTWKPAKDQAGSDMELFTGYAYAGPGASWKEEIEEGGFRQLQIREESSVENAGVLSITQLPWGSYRLKEKTPRDGYANTAADPSQLEFVVQENTVPGPVSLSIENSKNLLQIRKVSGDGTNTPLQGAEFVILDNTGKDFLKNLVTNEDGVIELKGSLPGGRDYILKEVNAPDGFELESREFPFRMNLDGTITAEPTAFAVVKEDNGIGYICFTDTPSPSVTPETSPSVTPETSPSVTPELSPSVTPETSPSVTPELSPSVTPETSPSVTPEVSPSVTPETSPSVTPELSPSVTPETSPSVTPETSPSVTPEVSPSVTPELSPSVTPELSPSVTPETSPSVTPELSPSITPEVSPSVTPETSPSVTPEMSPSVTPEVSPSVTPEVSPSVTPEVSPSVTPEVSPSVKPEVSPSITPETSPSVTPEVSPSVTPEASPSITPEVSPSITPEVSPSVTPEVSPSVTPEVSPSVTPEVSPSVTPEVSPSVTPEVSPSVTPEVSPSVTPETSPSVTPEVSPSVTPEVSPSVMPEASPSVTPEVSPSVTPEASLSITPEVSPSITPELSPSITPETSPSVTPEASPSITPEVSPSITPEVNPSVSPSVTPEVNPSVSPSVTPEASPSITPEVSPSVTPELSPSITPEISPSITPEASPSITPEASPSVTPELSPSITPETSPSITPEVSPSITPEVSPSVTPEVSPSITPEVSPSITPEMSPSATPEVSPSITPEVSPSVTPETSPSITPEVSTSVTPELSPSITPGTSPSITPEVSPSVTPESSPSVTPEISPSITPELSPSATPEPSLTVTPSPEPSPSATPTLEPSPSAAPTLKPMPEPSITPEVSPSITPEVSPSVTPETSPSITPEVSPSITPEASPSITPEASPSITPEASPSITPEVSPSVTPEWSPSVTPEISPSITPELSPSATPEPSLTVTPSPEPSPSAAPSPEPSPSVTPTPVPFLKGHVRLTKTLAGKGTPLQGAEFALYKEDGTLVAADLTTDLYGTWTSVESDAVRLDQETSPGEEPERLKEGLESGRYYFIETKAPAGAVLPPAGTTHVSFEIPEVPEGNQPVTVQVSIENEEFSASAELMKTDEDSGEGLKDVSFRLTFLPEDAPTEAVPAEMERVSTDADGKVRLDGLKKGTYTLEEILPAGYEDAFVAEFCVKDSDHGTTIRLARQEEQVKLLSGRWSEDGLSAVNRRLPGSVALIKVDGETGKQLNGVGFTLEYQKSGDASWETVQDPDGAPKEFFTGMRYAASDGGEIPIDPGTLQITGLPWGTYRLAEKTPLAGYTNVVEDPSQLVFTVRADALHHTIKINGKDVENTMNRLVIQKISQEENKLLEGAWFSILETDGTVVLDDLITDETGAIDLKGRLMGGKTYLLRETRAPAGYQLIQDISFTLSMDGTITLNETSGESVRLLPDGITLQAADPSVKASILKTDADTGKALAGAKLAIRDAYGQVVDSWITDTSAHRLNAVLSTGETYTLEEISAPEGYALASPLAFEVTEKNADNLQIVMEDPVTPREETQRHTGRITVTKSVFYGDMPIPVEETFYTALFADKALTQRISGVKEIVLQGTFNSSVTFENLPDGEYFVAETDEFGTPVSDGDGFYTAEVRDGDCVLNEESRNVGSLIINTAYDLPDGYFIGDSSIEVEKRLTTGEDPCTMDGSFYVALFMDPEYHYLVSDVKELIFNDSSSASVIFDKLADGTYYLAETDEYGFALEGSEEDLGFTILMPEKVFVVPGETGYFHTVFYNQFEEEPDLSPTEEPAVSPSATPSVTPADTPDTTMIPSPIPSSEKADDVKTGDETPLWLYVLLLLASGGVIREIRTQRRKKEQ